jgi:hypothetical protein
MAVIALAQICASAFFQQVYDDYPLSWMLHFQNCIEKSLPTRRAPVFVKCC